MREAVVRFIKENELLQKRRTVLVGVSGGPDSIALLHLLHSLKSDWEIDIQAITINHQLRDNAHLDSEFVRIFCEEGGIPVTQMVVSAQDYQAKNGVSTQVAARHVRYEAFRKCMAQFDKPILALGHHGDDQVETMILQMMRSSDPSAMLGIPVKRSFANGKIVRPLLAVTKDEIYTYCKEHQLEFVIDPSNEETTYTRNAVRKNVLPLFKERNKRIHQTVQKLSENLQADETYLQMQAKKLVKQYVTYTKTPRTATLKSKYFVNEPLPLQRRAFHLILNYLYDEQLGDLSYIHEELLFTLLNVNQRNQTIDFPQGLIVARTYNDINFRFKDDSKGSAFIKKEVQVPGEIDLPGGKVLKASFDKREMEEDTLLYILNESDVQLPLFVRTVKQGDVMRWRGLNGSKKVRRIFIDKKVPAYKREHWPLVVTNDGEVLWLIGLQKGEPKKQAKTGRQIYLSIEHKNNT